MRRAAWLLILLPACGLDTAIENENLIDDTRLMRADLEMRQLKNDLEQHHALRGEWPEDWSTVRRSGMDPWGGEYVFEIEGSNAVVHSAGPDGVHETGDDLSTR